MSWLVFSEWVGRFSIAAAAVPRPVVAITARRIAQMVAARGDGVYEVDRFCRIVDWSDY
jgi:hypothetical protein